MPQDTRDSYKHHKKIKPDIRQEAGDKFKKKSIMKSEGGDTGPWLQVIRRLRQRNKTGLVDSISRKQNRNFKKKKSI